MSTPNWLNTPPSSWPDLTEHWKRIVTGAFNKWTVQEPEDDSAIQAVYNIVGEAFSYVHQVYQWILDAIVPSMDTNALFLDDWEKHFDLKPGNTTADRIASIQGAARLLGKTATRSLVKAVFAPVFNTASDKVGITWARMEDIIAQAPETPWQWAFCIFNYHIYDTEETGSFIKALADTILQRLSPATHRVSAGPYETAKYDQDFGYDMSTYGE
jgi:uncharacterized protein YmfQ (DUF2313 family)